MSSLSSTLTNLLLTLPLVAGLLGSTTAAYAQTGATATVPFAFSANNVHEPAGTYRVQLLSDRFMCLRNVKTGKTQCLVVRPESERIIETQGRLVFQRYGSQKYLVQVWISGTNIHSEIAQKHEKAVLEATAPASAAQIEVALK
jgi:hypothetical protein